MIRLGALLFLLCFSVHAHSQQQFTCNDSFYQVFGNTGELLEYDIDTDTSTIEPFSGGRSINAMGYRTADNYAYGIFVNDPFELARLGADGGTANLGVVAGLPSMNFPTGDFSNDGLLYISRSIEPFLNTYFAIDVDTSTLVKTIVIAGPTFSSTDMAFNPRDGLFYTVNTAGEIPAQNLIAIDMETGTAEVIGPTGIPADANIASMFSDARGRIYGQNRNSATGELYEFNTTSGIGTLIGTTIVNTSTDGGVDGFYCFQNPGPDILSREIPTLSEWGLIAMAGILGIVGFIVLRRRISTV